MNQHVRTPKPPSEIEMKIFAVLKEIPNQKPDITEEHLRAWANGLNGVVVMATMNHCLPVSRKAGARTAKAELKKLAEHAEKIAATMNGLHFEATAAIRSALGEGRSWRRYIEVMNAVFAALHNANADAHLITGRAAKRSDKFVEEVTKAAASAFTGLTGRKAAALTRQVPNEGQKASKAEDYGPFLDFLADLYRVLNIKASPAYQARKL
jgi:hypothetical protein